MALRTITLREFVEVFSGLLYLWYSGSFALSGVQGIYALYKIHYHYEPATCVGHSYVREYQYDQLYFALTWTTIMDEDQDVFLSCPPRDAHYVIPSGTDACFGKKLWLPFWEVNATAPFPCMFNKHDRHAYTIPFFSWKPFVNCAVGFPLLIIFFFFVRKQHYD